MLTTILELLIVIPLAYIISMHIYGPVVVKRSERQPGQYHFELLDESQFFSERSDTFIMLDFEMRNLGFDYVGSSVLANTNTDSFFSLYTKADEALSAMLTTIESPLGDFTYAEFTRLYEDGSSLEINNAPISPLFPRNPLRLQFRYPKENSLSGLYGVIQQLLRVHQNSAPPLPLTPGHEFEQVEGLMNRELERLVNGGYYSVEVIDGYRPITVKGAWRFSWKSLWPWQTIRQQFDLCCSNRALARARRAT